MRRVKATIGTNSVSTIQTTISLTPSKWNLVTVSFMVLYHEIASNTIIIYFDSTKQVAKDPFAIPTGTLAFANDDKIRIGGPDSFIGLISNFRIYYPGSNLLNSGISPLLFGKL